MENISELGLWEQLFQYFQNNGFYVLSQFLRHFLMSFYGVVFAMIIAIPLGFYIAHNPKGSQWIIAIANTIQTVPQLALLSILMLVLGLGTNLVVLTVFLYSLLPIIRNTYTGVSSLDPGLIDVGKGMGMKRWQLIFKVEFPLALPVIMGGIRNAFITGIGISTIGTFVGAGGLGDILTRGVNASDGTSIILAGVIPIALMAMATDWLLSFIETKMDPSRDKA